MGVTAGDPAPTPRPPFFDDVRDILTPAVPGLSGQGYFYDLIDGLIAPAPPQSPRSARPPSLTVPVGLPDPRSAVGPRLGVPPGLPAPRSARDLPNTRGMPAPGSVSLPDPDPFHYPDLGERRAVIAAGGGGTVSPQPPGGGGLKQQPTFTSPSGGTLGSPAAIAAEVQSVALAELEGVLAQFGDRSDAIDAAYEEDLAALQDLFKATDDPREQAMLAEQLAGLETAYQNAAMGIQQAFGLAQSQIEGRAVQTLARSVEQADRVAGNYVLGRESLSEGARFSDEANSVLGLAVNSDGGSDVSAERGYLATVGDAESDLALQLGQIGADGQQFLASMMSAEQAARTTEARGRVDSQQGALRQTALQAQIDRDREAQRALQQGTFDLMRGRREDQMQLGLAEMDVALALEKMRNDNEQSQADRSLRASLGAGGGGGGGGGGPSVADQIAEWAALGPDGLTYAIENGLIPDFLQDEPEESGGVMGAIQNGLAWLVENLGG